MKYKNEKKKTHELARYIYDWLNEYLPTLKANSAHTIRNYRTAINLFVEFLESIDIDSSNFNAHCFSADNITKWLQWMKTNKNCVNRTCNNRLAALNNLLKYLGIRNVEYRTLHAESSNNVSYLREPKKKVDVITKDAVKCVFATVDTSNKTGFRDMVFMVLQYGTAMRIDEILSLKVKHIQIRGEKPQVIILGKGRKIRSVPLVGKITEYLRTYIKLFHGENFNPEDYLFYSTWHGQKTKLSQEAMRKRLRKHIEIAHKVNEDVPLTFHAHQWRHARASHWLDEGLNIAEISRLLGHENIQTTMIYQSITIEQQREAMEKLQGETSFYTPKKYEAKSSQELSVMLSFLKE